MDLDTKIAENQPNSHLGVIRLRLAGSDTVIPAYPVGSIDHIMNLAQSGAKFYTFQGYQVDYTYILQAPLIATLKQIKEGLLFYGIPADQEAK